MDSKARINAVLIAAVGLVVGALSFLAQGRLPGDWYHLGNSGSVWLLVAFWAGTRLASFYGGSSQSAKYRWAALAGMGVLLATLAGYFMTGSLFEVPYSLVWVIYWGGIALVGGPVFGLAGAASRDERPAWRVIALALLGGAFAAEGLFHLIYNPHLQAVAWALLAAGLLLPLLLGRSNRDRWAAALTLIPAALVGLGFYVLIQWVQYQM